MAIQTRELLLLAGRVETMGPPTAAPAADAILVRDGRIAAVGAGSDLRREVGAGAEVIDFPGATVLPGINDSHLHLASWGTTRSPLALDVSPREVGSIADVVDAVRSAVRETPEGQWIRGSGWHLASLAECVSDRHRQPTRQDLDAVAPDHPVALADFSQHALWVNSRALTIARVDANTETPPGGEIPRDEHGEPIGILSEFAAQRLVARHLPTFTREDRKAAIREAAATLHQLGITSVTDPALGPGGGEGILGTDTIRAYEELLRDGELRLRVNVLLLFGGEGSATASDVEAGLREVHIASGDERWLREAGMKIFADGIPPLYTSWLWEPYEGDERTGSLVIPGEDDDDRVAELAEMVRLAHVAGHQVGIHATGDRAIDASVDAFTAAQRSHPRDDPRHYIIHGDLTSAATLRAMAREGFGLNVQPQIKPGAAELMTSLLGQARSAYQWPNRLALDSGVRIAFSSDAPVCWPDWREGVAAAVLRRSYATGSVAGPEQCIDVCEALHAYTAGSAYQDHAEDFKGTIAPGRAADLCVLGANPLEVDPQDIPAIEIVATLVDGTVVFRK
jgi:predicted amidohydrolase YtcJ